MEIFSEIYGIYYAFISDVLKQFKISSLEIHNLKTKYSIEDTSLFLEKYFYPNKNTEDKWKLLSYDDKSKMFYSNLDNKPITLPITNLEKSWIKALLQDDKFKLFLADEFIEELNSQLKDIQPLFNMDTFYYFDQSKDGDDFKNPQYKENFQTIVKAIHDKKTIYIEKYVSSKGNTICGNFQPLNIEYSSKDDMFRLFCGTLTENDNIQYNILNLSGILSPITISDTPWNDNIKMDNQTLEDNSFFSNKKCIEPIKVRVSNEKRSIERFMIEFSCYEKKAEYDLNTNTAIVEIWYNIMDETELLIRLLSFGKYLEIISPQNIREQAKERIKAQYDLLFN